MKTSLRSLLLAVTFSLAALLLGGCVSPLLSAANNGDLAKVKALVESGAEDINRGGVNGWNALHFAASSGETEVVKYLLDKGAYINAINGDGNTPLTLAIIWKHPQTAQYLVSRGADLNLCGALNVASKYCMENLLLNATARGVSNPAPASRRASEPTQSPAAETKPKPSAETIQPLL